MALISVREYKSLKIGEFDPACKDCLSVTEQQADLLTNPKITNGLEVFKYANKTSLIAQQYVGVFQLGPLTVEVLPKIDGDDQSVRRNLVAMLAVALDLEISEGEMALVSTQQKDFVSQQDFYQMYAYANSYDCPDVVLLYPHYRELGLDAGIRGSYLLNPWIHEISSSQSHRVKIATIDLSNLKTVVSQLKEIILVDRKSRNSLKER